MEVSHAEEAIRANLGPGFDPESVLDQFNSEDIKQIEDLIDTRLIRNLIQEEANGNCLPQTNVNYPEGVRGGLVNNGHLDTPNLKGSPQRVPPSTHPGPSPGYHGNHQGHLQPQQAHQGSAHQPQQGHGAHPPQQGHGTHPPQQGHGAHPPQQGHGAHPPQQRHGAHPSQQGHCGKNQFVHTQFPESPPDSGSEPYSPPNDHNHQQHQENSTQYNVKPNGMPTGMPNMAPGAHHPMYMSGGLGPPTGPSHSHGPPSGPTNMHSSMSPPQDQHSSPNGHHQSPPHSVQFAGHPPGAMRPYIYPMGVGVEPPKLQHPAANSGLTLNVHGLPNPPSSMNNLTNQPAKKRKFSDSPNSTINQHYIQQMVACMPPVGLNIKQEPGLLDCEDDYYDPQMFMDGAFQVIKWQSFQQNKWCTLLDENGKELPSLNYRVDADKGFNFSPSDDSFVCQKKNHFQVTAHISFSGLPKYVKNNEGVIKSIESYALHFNGIKAESTSQTIKVEQSQSDRTKRPFHPVKVDLNPEQVNKFTVGRMHFSETTSNNMRKKGKPNPDQRYFMLVVSLHAHHGSESFLLASHKSERIIVRASNPGQFDSEVDVLWNKGRSPDSVVHMGRVGINNESPDEALTVHGNLHVTGAIVQPSDRRAKTNIREMDTKEQLKNISLMKLYKYAYSDRFADFAGLTDDEKEDTGVLAQELAEVLPDAVKVTGDVVYPDGDEIEDFMVINKDRIYMESIGAVKELCKVTDKLETRINEIEGMDRKLNKHGSKTRDSMISTCSSLSFSTCSTISRSSSVRPPTDSKPSNKKSSEKSSSTEKCSSDKDKSSSGKKGGSTEHRSHHRHHHHHHRHDHHSSSRGNSTPPAPPANGPCNNRLIQITVIVLVLVMAFCLISITVLYILERKLPATQVESTPEISNGSFGVPTTPIDKTTTPPPPKDRNNTDVQQLTPPRCLLQKCNVTCCSAHPDQTFDDPSKSRVINKPGKHQDTKPKDEGGKDVPYKVLPPDQDTLPAGRQPKHQASSDVWLPDKEDNQPSRDVPRLAPGNYTPAGRQRPNTTKPKKSQLVKIHHIDRDDPPMDDPVMISDIKEDYNVYDMEKPMKSPLVIHNINRDDPPIDREDNPVMINDINEDYHVEPPSVEISNQPKIVVMDSDNHNNGRRKRAADFHNYPATLLFVQINKTIDQMYCLDNHCHQGGNYSYYIPMSPVFPQAFITVEFQIRVTSELMHVYLCEEQELQACDGVSVDDDMKIIAQKNHENKWDLPIGYYFMSYFKFRVAGSSEEQDEVCKWEDSLAGQTYSEYNLRFQRICDNLPSY